VRRFVAAKKSPAADLFGKNLLGAGPVDKDGGNVMRRYAVVAAVVGALVIAGGAYGVGRYVITNINQIKPRVLAQLYGPGIVRVVESPKVVLQPGQSSYDVNPKNFQATCPRGWTVIGTSFSTGGGEAWAVVDYGGYFVGGFIVNLSSTPDKPAYVAAQCAIVPGGSVGRARDISGPESQYKAELRTDEAKARRTQGQRG
jgi:hypothetical protein